MLGRDSSPTTALLGGGPSAASPLGLRFASRRLSLPPFFHLSFNHLTKILNFLRNITQINTHSEFTT